MLFGGEVQDGTLHLSEFVGTRTNNLKGLAIPPRSGMGGRVVAQGSPITVNDYGNSQSITHHFDRPVLSEGLHSIIAVPVMVSGKSRAVLYAAIRDSAPLGDRTADVMVGASRRLGMEFANPRRSRSVACNYCRPPPRLPPTVCLRKRSAESTPNYRSVAQTVTDTDLQTKLRGLSQRLANLLRPTADDRIRRHAHPRVKWTFSLRSHSAAPTSKPANGFPFARKQSRAICEARWESWTASSRHEAVVTARRLGLLP